VTTNSEQHPPLRERWRPALRAVLYFIAFVLTYGAASLLVYGVLLLAGLEFLLMTGQPIVTSPIVLPLYLLVLLAVLGLTWLFARLLDRRRLQDFGLALKGPWLRDLGLGTGLGILLMSAITVVELLSGWYRLAGFGWEVQPIGTLLGAIVVSFLLFVMVALIEELAFRGYILQNLEREWGPSVALIASSTIFAALHSTNPGADVVPILSLIAAGLLLGAGYLITRTLWLPIGLHFSWNFFQGPIFGFPVSGASAGGLLRPVAVGPDSLTGGSFGPEASLVGVAAEVLGLALLWVWASKRIEGARAR
jgi:uncharacterized protein